MQQDAPEASAASSEKRKKKKRRRKREEMVNRLKTDSVRCHQDEDWCLGQSWNLISAVKESTEGYSTKHQSVSPAGGPLTGPVLKKKKMRNNRVEFRDGAALSIRSVSTIKTTSARIIYTSISVPGIHLHRHS